MWKLKCSGSDVRKSKSARIDASKAKYVGGLRFLFLEELDELDVFVFVLEDGVVFVAITAPFAEPISLPDA